MGTLGCKHLHGFLPGRYWQDGVSSGEPAWESGWFPVSRKSQSSETTSKCKCPIFRECLEAGGFACPSELRVLADTNNQCSQMENNCLLALVEWICNKQVSLALRVRCFYDLPFGVRLESRGTKMWNPNTLTLSKELELGLPPKCMVVYLVWGLWRECVSFPCLYQCGYFLFCSMCRSLSASFWILSESVALWATLHWWDWGRKGLQEFPMS